MKGRFNYKIYGAIFLTIALAFFAIIFFYEGVKLGTSDFGQFGNMLILGLADLFQFPINTLVKPSSGTFYFLGIFFNIAIYALILYLMSKVILKFIKKTQ